MSTSPQAQSPTPVWPDLTFEAIFKIAFRDRRSGAGVDPAFVSAQAISMPATANAAPGLRPCGAAGVHRYRSARAHRRADGSVICLLAP